MKRSKGKKDNQNLVIALYFFLGIFLLLVFSATFKTVAVIRASSFDGTHRFTIAVRAKETTVYSFEPQANVLSVLTIKNANDSLSAERFIAVPVDGSIADATITDNTSVTNTLFSLMLHYRKIKTNLTFFDLLRLFSYSRSIDQSAVVKQSVTMSDDLKTVEGVLGNHFSDQSITGENVSIEILNGTNTVGLGNRLARFITHMGGNVVFVSSTEKERERSEISFSETKLDYTVKRLQSALHMPVVFGKKKELGDVIIVVGRDAFRNTNGIMY